LGNALKFTPKGSICLKVRLDRSNPSLIHLLIIDNGIGIKEENKRMLFTAFGKVQEGENEYLNSQGVGLGLLISNKLAISMGPKDPLSVKTDISNFNINPGLNVVSQFGKGTTFRLFIIICMNLII
jgi:signal transduction histidine kinase